MAITSADYNNIRQKVIGVLGTGAGGYGQAPVSSAATSTNVISATLWNGLRTDMIKSRQHQTGEDESANLPILTRTTPITESLRQQFDTYANLVVTNKKEIGLTGSIPQGQNESFATSTVFSSIWTTTLYHKVVVTFASALAANYWFNAGGQFRFYAAKVGSTVNSKDLEWSTLIGNSTTKNGDSNSGFGKVYMNYGTISTLPGTASSAGTAFPAFSFYNNSPSWDTVNLPASATTIFFKQFSGYGAVNRYQIQMYANNATAPTALTFLITFQDLVGGGIDDSITGQLTSYVDILRPTVSGGVTLNAPTRSTNTGLTTTVQT
jgi:hypothetical protein